MGQDSRNEPQTGGPTSSPKMPDVDEVDYSSMWIGVFISLLILVIFVYLKRKSAALRGILITGLCDSGKTLLYSRLVHNKFVLTQTSIKENSDEYSIQGKYVRIVDIPGHERLRGQFLDRHKGSARGIIYVVDSQTIQKDIKDVAEFLYNILTDPVIRANAPAILILCNKQDQPLVKNSNEIRSMLEKEMNTLRITKSSQLDSVDSNAKNPIFLGDKNIAFTFDALTAFKIDFADAFGTNEERECKLDEIEKWLMRVA